MITFPIVLFKKMSLDSCYREYYSTSCPNTMVLIDADRWDWLEDDTAGREGRDEVTTLRIRCKRDTEFTLPNREYFITFPMKYRGISNPDDRYNNSTIASISSNGRYLVVWFQIEGFEEEKFTNKHRVFVVHIDTFEKESCEGDVFEEFKAFYDVTSRKKYHHLCWMSALDNGLVYVGNPSPLESYIFDPSSRGVVEILKFKNLFASLATENKLYLFQDKIGDSIEYLEYDMNTRESVSKNKKWDDLNLPLNLIVPICPGN